MPLFGVSLSDIDNIALGYIDEVDIRLKESNLIKNPFKGGTYQIFYPKEQKMGFIVYIEPVYPNFSQLAWLPLILLYMFLGLNFFSLLFFIIVILGFIFWDLDYLYFFMFKKGLEKKGYAGDIKKIRLDKTIVGWLFNGAE